MKTPEETAAAIEASMRHDYDPAEARRAIADALRDYHAAKLKEALAGGPVTEGRLEEIRDYARRDLIIGASVLAEYRLALDHALARNLALDGKLCDLLSLDGRALVEEGRRRERAEIVAWLGRCRDEITGLPRAHDDITAAQNFGKFLALRGAADQIAARGPAPDPWPGDGARRRAAELEARVRELEHEVAVAKSGSQAVAALP